MRDEGKVPQARCGGLSPKEKVRGGAGAPPQDLAGRWFGLGGYVEGWRRLEERENVGLSRVNGPRVGRMKMWLCRVEGSRSLEVLEGGR